MTQTTPLFKDLTPAVIQAKAGVKSQVKPLFDQLNEGGFYLAMARPVNISHNSFPAEDVPLSSHMIGHPQTEHIYAVLFTREDLVQNAGAQMGWTTEGLGQLMACPLPSNRALFYITRLMQRDPNIVGLLINPFDEASAIQLQPYEVDRMLGRHLIPFVGYAPNTPMGEAESIQVRLTDLTEVPQFTQAVQNFMASHPNITNHEVVALFNDERDVDPYLAINLHTTQPQEQYQALAQAFIQEVQPHIPPPGYLEVLFNEKLPGIY